MGVEVLLGVRVGVGLAVKVKLWVGEGLGVGVPVAEGLAVGVALGLGLGVCDGVAVRVAVRVGVLVGVALGLAVGVAVAVLHPTVVVTLLEVKSMAGKETWNPTSLTRVAGQALTTATILQVPMAPAGRSPKGSVTSCPDAVPPQVDDT